MLFNLYTYLNKDKEIGLRKHNILKYEKGIRNNILINIEDYLINKYQFDEDNLINKNELIKAQEKFLLNYIKY